jgi:succinoglycan biosynthesis protein ExoV
VQLYYYRHRNGVANFGDDLNPLIWNRLLPEYIDDNPEERLFAIGTVLGPRVTSEPKRVVVMGSGTGYYAAYPRVDERWTVYCVRGPLTAAKLGLDSDLAVTDPAYLLRDIVSESAPCSRSVGFMPHVSQADKYWRSICEKLGIVFIDPRLHPLECVHMILRCRILFTEALHGAIVADSFGIPWVAVRSNALILRFKWEDWLGSIGLPYAPCTLPAAWSDPAIVIPGRSLYPIDRNWRRGAVKRVLGPLRRLQCAVGLKQAVREAKPQLSARYVVEEKIGRLYDRLEHFRSCESKVSDSIRRSAGNGGP